MRWTPLTWTMYAAAWRVCRRVWRWLYRRTPARVLPAWTPGRLDLGHGWTLHTLPEAGTRRTVQVLARGRRCWGSTPRLEDWQRARWSEEN